MPTRVQRSGGYTPSEAHTTMVASKYHNGLAGRAVIYCHGAGGNGFVTDAAVREDLAHHARRGWVISAPLLGGVTTWGNAASVSAVDAVLAYLATTYGADTTKPLFVADSHGAPIALNWAVRNPSDFGGAVLRVPAFSLKTIHDTNIAGLAAGMEAAYGGLAGLEAAYSTRDANHPTFQALVVSSGIVPRLRVMYNAADPIINPVDVLAFETATGVETIEMGGPDHAPWGYFDILDQYDWLKSRTEM